MNEKILSCFARVVVCEYTLQYCLAHKDIKRNAGPSITLYFFTMSHITLLLCFDAPSKYNLNVKNVNAEQISVQNV